MTKLLCATQVGPVHAKLVVLFPLKLPSEVRTDDLAPVLSASVLVLGLLLLFPLPMSILPTINQATMRIRTRALTRKVMAQDEHPGDV